MKTTSLAAIVALCFVITACSKKNQAASAYGDVPTVGQGMSGPVIPSAMSRGIKQALRAPETLVVRETSKPIPTTHNGEKCYEVSASFSSQNGFGGMTAGHATAWMRGSELLDISVE